jgi:catechol 2,3-dioxygenase-like lactoylglutathione lyase family enzyme
VRRVLLFGLMAFVIAGASLAVSSSPGQPATTDRANTGLDHIPIAVTDLEAAAERYRALGFVLKPGRPHDNGIRNQHAKFLDGTELELITAPEARDELTSIYRTHLAEGDGPAFLAFFAPAFAEAGRQAAPSYVFFGGLNRSPTDKPEHFAHPNGAEALIGVWLAADDLSRERKLLQAMGATIERREVHVPDPLTTDVARLAGDEVVLLPGRFQIVPGRRIVGASVAVKSVASARRLLERSRGAPLRVAAQSVFLPPSATNGLWLELREGR